jgi:hypothetical protein
MRIKHVAIAGCQACFDDLDALSGPDPDMQFWTHGLDVGNAKARAPRDAGGFEPAS